MRCTVVTMVQRGNAHTMHIIFLIISVCCVRSFTEHITTPKTISTITESVQTQHVTTETKITKVETIESEVVTTENILLDVTTTEVFISQNATEKSVVPRGVTPKNNNKTIITETPKQVIRAILQKQTQENKSLEWETGNQTLVEDLSVTNASKNQVTLVWKGTAKVDFYKVGIQPPENYPHIPITSTYNTKFKLNNLSPGAAYTFTVTPVFNHSQGQKAAINFETPGGQLPEVKSSHISAQKFYNNIQLRWEPPNAEQNWTYGVYFGESAEELFRGPIVKARALSATIKHLKSCRRYLISVGIIGPMGPGPVSQNAQKVFTGLDRYSPPRNLSVRMDTVGLKMMVTWESSCQVIDEPIGYYVVIREYSTASATVLDVEKSRNTSFERRFKTVFGGLYDVKVTTDEFGALPAKLHFSAPYFLQPYNLEVKCDNQSASLTWQQPVVPYYIGPYKYEVVASDQKSNDTIRVEVRKPPFHFKYGGENYTFGVLFKTVDCRIRSAVSKTVSCYKIT